MISLFRICWIRIEYIPFMPICVKLLLDQLNYLFLFSFYASLLFLKTIKLGLFIGYFFTILIDVTNARIWIFVPNVKNGYQNVST